MKVYRISFYLDITPLSEYLEVDLKKFLKDRPYSQYHVQHNVEQAKGDERNIIRRIYIRNLYLFENEIKKVVISKGQFEWYVNNVFHRLEHPVAYEEELKYVLSFLYAKLNLNNFSVRDVEFQLGLDEDGNEWDVIDSSEINLIYTDGSTNKHEGSASWAFVMLDPNNNTTIKEDCELFNEKRSYEVKSGKISKGTNSVAELTAMLNALAQINITRHRHNIVIVDSEYTANTIRIWYEEWQNKHKYSYKNRNLIDNIMQLFRNANTHIITTILWTKSHVGTFFNEVADSAAKAELS